MYAGHWTFVLGTETGVGLTYLKHNLNINKSTYPFIRGRERGSGAHWHK